MPIGPARMPLMDHLGELRRRLTIVVASVVAATVFMYFAAPTLVDILKDPINGSLQPGEQLSVMTSLGGFSIKFNIAVKVALAMCTPMIVWQILAFFLPALRPNERKWVVPTVLVATACSLPAWCFATSSSPRLPLNGCFRRRARSAPPCRSLRISSTPSCCS